MESLDHVNRPGLSITNLIHTFHTIAVTIFGKKMAMNSPLIHLTAGRWMWLEFWHLTELWMRDFLTNLNPDTVHSKNHPSLPPKEPKLVQTSSSQSVRRVPTEEKGLTRREQRTLSGCSMHWWGSSGWSLSSLWEAHENYSG